MGEHQTVWVALPGLQLEALWGEVRAYLPAPSRRCGTYKLAKPFGSGHWDANGRQTLGSDHPMRMGANFAAKLPACI